MADTELAMERKIFRQPAIPFSPKYYICYRVEKPIRIDGNIDKEIWNKAEWSDEFVDIEGPSKPPPRLKTRVKMLWDDECLYIAARLEEPNIWATITERDAVIFQDNDFEIFIDPDGDTHNYYELEVNALGTVWDLMLVKPYRDGDRVAISSWYVSGLRVGVHLDGKLNDTTGTSKGWNVEIAIPWDALKESAPRTERPVGGDQWRINFSRVEWRLKVLDGKFVKERDEKTGEHLPECNWVWSPQGLIDMHYPEMWGFVQFSSNTAGSGKDVFRQRNEEIAKWALRRLYYAEKGYFLNHGCYTSDLARLNLNGETPPGFTWPPKVSVTPSLFEAVINRVGSSEKLHIKEDGKVWTSGR